MAPRKPATADKAEPKKATSPNRRYAGEVEQYFPTLAVVDAEGNTRVGVLLAPGDVVTLADPAVDHSSLEEA